MTHSFLLIGQSNMAGRGHLDEALPIDKTNIRVLRNGRWQPMYRPVTCDRSFSGVCLAESFAERYAATYGVTAGLIPCADGGTSLAQWAPGGLLYDHAVAMARLAMRTSHLVGILWHQGEADCAPVPSPTFSTRLTALIESLRRDLGAPEIPFIIGALGDFLADRTVSPGLAYYPAINALLEEVASTVPHCAFVPAHGLTANEDNLHFNAASLHAFGLRYFDAFTPLHRPELYTEEHGTDGVRTAMEAL
jgi:hypothetical protein